MAACSGKRRRLTAESQLEYEAERLRMNLYEVREREPLLYMWRGKRLNDGREELAA